MATSYFQQIRDYFRNLALNASGTERTLYELIQDRDIAKAIELMRNRDDEVNKAIEEYYPSTHGVMDRPDKSRKNKDSYVTEKLPRNRQRYINEVELFFLFGSPIKWDFVEGDEEAFALFKEFLEKHRFDSNMRKAKRLAGAETESAKLYHIYRNDKVGERQVKSVVLARSTGYRLRPLFDQYGNLVAMGYGYSLKENGKTVEHWDIQTPDSLVYSKRTALGWEVEQFPNPTGKINIIYYQQPKAWDGVEQRLHREEMLDSKIADTNNYFADPIAKATGDVIQGLADPDTAGKLIQLTDNESKFEYINPPQNSEARREEKFELNKSILFDTFTPDLSFESLKGMGSLSGTAIKNAMILGYIKRDNLKEVYDEMLDREKNVILGILKYLHPDKAKAFDELKISYEFTEPFAVDRQQDIKTLVELYKAGLLSQETTISKLDVVDMPSTEIERIKAEIEQARATQQQEQIGFKATEENEQISE